MVFLRSCLLQPVEKSQARRGKVARYAFSPYIEMLSFLSLVNFINLGFLIAFGVAKPLSSHVL